MKINHTDTSLGIAVSLDGKDDFFDGWIKQGIRIMGITFHGVKWVIRDGNHYYDLSGAKRLIEWRKSNSPNKKIIDMIHEFYPGIDGDGVKDIYKMLDIEEEIS